MPEIQEPRLAVHTWDRTWRYHIDEQEMRIASASKFARLTREEFNGGNPQVFALVCLDQPLDDRAQAGRIQIAAVGQTDGETDLTQVLPA